MDEQRQIKITSHPAISLPAPRAPAAGKETNKQRAARAEPRPGRSPLRGSYGVLRALGELHGARHRR